MNKKILVLCLITLGFLTISIGAASASTISVTDDIDDVGKYDANEEFVENVSILPNMDLEQLTCEQDGKEVTITMKLKDGGIIEKDSDSYYMIFLDTTAYGELDYMITYTGIDMSDFGFEGEIIIMDANGDYITPTSYSGVETNTLTIVFDLRTSYERIIGLAAINQKNPDTSDYSYAELAPNDIVDIFPITEELYNATVKKSVTFTGSLEEGDPDDYEWLWTYENVKTVKEGQTASYTFDIPGEYLGVLYVYDGHGNYGEAYFTINVTGTADGGNGGNGGIIGNPLIFIGLVIIIIIVGIIVVVVISKR